MPSIRCPHCGAPNPDRLDNCYNCQKVLRIVDPLTQAQPSLPSVVTPTANSLSIRWMYAAVGVLLFVILAGTSLSGGLRVYDYKVVELQAVNPEHAEGGLNIDSSALQKLGRQGWELVGTVTDVETSFPNFGNEEYHTGIKSNTHTRTAFLLFKKSRLRWLKPAS